MQGLCQTPRFSSSAEGLNSPLKSPLMLLSLSGLYTCHHQHESINSILGTICSEGYRQPLPDLFFFFFFPLQIYRMVFYSFIFIWLISFSITLLIYSVVYVDFSVYEISIAFEI